MSARRSRKRRKPPARRKTRSKARRRGTAPSAATALRVAGVAAAGLALGYLIAVFVIFPAPGPPKDVREIPDLRQRTALAAERVIEEAGLVMGTLRTIRHPSIDSNAVVGQSPLPSQLARAGDTVDLVLSLGPERRRVPEVRRLRGDRAADLLAATGFGVVVDSVASAVARGRVIGIEPEEGTPLTLPGEVRLTVSLGPPTVRMPFLLGMMEEEARDTLSVLGLEVIGVREVFRFGRDQGRVVSQDPAEDTELERGAEVLLEVGRRGGIPQEH